MSLQPVGSYTGECIRYLPYLMGCRTQTGHVNHLLNPYSVCFFLPSPFWGPTPDSNTVEMFPVNYVLGSLLFSCLRISGSSQYLYLRSLTALCLPISPFKVLQLIKVYLVAP